MSKVLGFLSQPLSPPTQHAKITHSSPRDVRVLYVCHMEMVANLISILFRLPFLPEYTYLKESLRFSFVFPRLHRPGSFPDLSKIIPQSVLPRGSSCSTLDTCSVQGHDKRHFQRRSFTAMTQTSPSHRRTPSTPYTSKSKSSRPVLHRRGTSGATVTISKLGSGKDRGVKSSQDDFDMASFLNFWYVIQPTPLLSINCCMDSVHMPAAVTCVSLTGLLYQHKS